MENAGVDDANHFCQNGCVHFDYIHDCRHCAESGLSGEHRFVVTLSRFLLNEFGQLLRKLLTDLHRKGSKVIRKRGQDVSERDYHFFILELLHQEEIALEHQVKTGPDEDHGTLVVHHLL